MADIAHTDRVIIGVDEFHFAPLTADDSTTLTYGSMVRVPLTIEVNVNTNSATETLFADNQPAIVYTTIGVVEVTINRTNLPNSLLTAWLGSPVVGGIRYITSTQTAPYIGIAFRQLYSDGTYAYVKVYKGKFSEPEHNAKTKEDGVEFQTREIVGNFVATLHKKTLGSVTTSLVMAIADETDAGYTNEGSTWFTAMIPA